MKGKNKKTGPEAGLVVGSHRSRRRKALIRLGRAFSKTETHITINKRYGILGGFLAEYRLKRN